MRDRKLSRRDVLKTSTALAAGAVFAEPFNAAALEPTAVTPGRTLNLWAFGDSHVGTDKTFGRDSLADALTQSEFGGNEGGPPFDWDIAINVGDVSGAQAPPVDEEGKEIVRQFQKLKKHKREDIYDLCGNHDRSGLDQPDAWWWQKWIDPLGQHTEFSGVKPAQRPYPIEGTWERYSFRVGNILFLIMSDRNEPSQKVGRGTLGGNPGGVVSGETFAWWKQMVEANPSSIIISAHHYVLKNTTVASGEWEGMRIENGKLVSHYHGYFEQGTPKGASYLYWVDSKPDAQAFESYLDSHPGAVQMWLGGHTHTNPDDTYGGKSHLEQKWGVYFLNVSALSKYHVIKTTTPMSRLLTFAEGSDKVRVQCYMHTSQYAPQGWYPRVERTLKLARAFYW
jgi:Calcineurin-like phosphoesterase